MKTDRKFLDTKRLLNVKELLQKIGLHEKERFGSYKDKRRSKKGDKIR